MKIFLRNVYITVLSLWIAFLSFASPSVQKRLETRSFPSIFTAWSISLNRPDLSVDENVATHDLLFDAYFHLRFKRIESGQITLTDASLGWKTSQVLYDIFTQSNPNMIFLATLPMRQVPRKDPKHPFGQLFDEAHFIKDQKGQSVIESAGDTLLDFTHPEVQDILVEMAIAISKNEFIDGIFIDFWNEKGVILEGYRSYELEQSVRMSILKRIREAVEDDFLILVNGLSLTENTAPYINGTFMETFRAQRKNYNHEGVEEMGKQLLWAAENLREPRINCLEAEGIGSESPLSPANKQAMRCFTTMSLTHSNGFVVYTMGIQWDEPHEHDRFFLHPRQPNHVRDHDYRHLHHHDHYWYPFWDADLGQPVGEKGQLYEGIEGVFIREYTNGWVVHNRSGEAQVIELPIKSNGVESGVSSIRHTVPDLDGEIYLKMPTLTADVNADGVVNILDLVVVANGFGKDAPDVNGDGTVNVLDLVAVANAF